MTQRIAIELEVKVLDETGGEPRVVYTAEVGPGGLWLRGAGVPEPDRPVKLAVVDVAIGELVVHGVVGQPAAGRDGVEVALFDNPPEVERRWRALLERLTREAGLRPATGSAVPSAGAPPTGPIPEPRNVINTSTGPLPAAPAPAPQAEDAPPNTGSHDFPQSSRAHIRRSSNLRISLRFSDGATASAVIRDLSEGGALVTGPHLPRVGEDVEVSIAHPVTGAPVELPAKVVRTVTHGPDGHHGVGIKFMDDAAAHVPWAVFGGRPMTGRGTSDRDRTLAGASSRRPDDAEE